MSLGASSCIEAVTAPACGAVSLNSNHALVVFGCVQPWRQNPSRCPQPKIDRDANQNSVVYWWQPAWESHIKCHIHTISQHGKVNWGSVDFFSTGPSLGQRGFDFGGHGMRGHIASHGGARQETVGVVSEGWMLSWRTVCQERCGFYMLTLAPHST